MTGAMVDLVDLFDFIDEIVMVVDENYKILYLNNKVRELLGGYPSEFVGRKCHLALFNKTSMCENCQIPGLIEKKLSVSIVHDTTSYKGLRKLYRANFERVGINNFSEVLFDITEEKRLIDQLTHQSKALKANNVVLE